MTIQIRPASVADVDSIVPIFDAYRQFYEQPSDPARARCFLLERLERAESVILLALKDDTPAGFTQLYPSFSSASLGRIFVLNDLFVHAGMRGRGVGSALLDAAATYAREAGALRLVLSTGVNNKTAQSLYERKGWKRDLNFFVYQLPL